MTDDTAVIRVPIQRRDGSQFVVLIDASDAPLVLGGQYSWYFSHHGYITAYVKGSMPRRRIYLHRLIMSEPEGMYVDHINHNPLDNRRCNLRVVTSSLNGLNRTGPPSNSSTGERGVKWSKQKQRWIASINIEKHAYHLGSYIDKESAIQIAREAVDKAFSMTLDEWQAWRLSRVRPPRTHCKHGHELTPENSTVRAYDGTVLCLTCKRTYQRNGRLRRKERPS